MRNAFQHYFSRRAIIAVSFETDRTGKRTRRFYVLEREQSS